MTGGRVEFDCMGELLDQVYDDLIHFWYLDGALYSYMGYRSVPVLVDATELARSEEGKWFTLKMGF